MLMLLWLACGDADAPAIVDESQFQGDGLCCIEAQLTDSGGNGWKRGYLELMTSDPGDFPEPNARISLLDGYQGIVETCVPPGTQLEAYYTHGQPNHEIGFELLIAGESILNIEADPPSGSVLEQQIGCAEEDRVTKDYSPYQSENASNWHETDDTPSGSWSTHFREFNLQQQIYGPDGNLFCEGIVTIDLEEDGSANGQGSCRPESMPGLAIVQRYTAQHHPASDEANTIDVEIADIVGELSIEVNGGNTFMQNQLVELPFSGECFEQAGEIPTVVIHWEAQLRTENGPMWIRSHLFGQ